MAEENQEENLDNKARCIKDYGFRNQYNKYRVPNYYSYY